MPCLKKILVKCFLLAQLLVGVWAQSPAPTPAAQAVAEISTLTMTRLDKQLGISAQVKFELPAAIEEAMYKGVSLTFVAEVDITRDRWYWTDKTMATSARQIRISYQALTRRWRVLPWSDISSAAGLGVQLPQTYETLAEALAIAQRIYHWRVVDLMDISDANHWVQLRYRLDISQLPKPLQIGLLGQGDWAISASTRQRLSALEVKP
jgi:Domain of unknown function (DUF4390)